MNRQGILLASGNPGKLAELRRLSGDLPVDIRGPESLENGLPHVEETGSSFLENAVIKALSAADAAVADGGDDWALADDSGLAVDFLDGAPGIRSARFAGTQGKGRDLANNALLLEKLKGLPPEGRRASFWCVLALARPGQVLLAVEGSVEGWILDAPRGKGGFGYDPLFFHEPSDRTFAQLEPEEKVSISHRSMAMTRLKTALESLVPQGTA